ncbi:MAG: hypothetical protein JKY65_07065 [Planctomycetes bacterium]|nr:hypothetical protein [Planctomycetota bacterium]
MRPLFPTLVGHDQVKQDLFNCLQRGRLRGSFLLVGPEGVGKALFAEQLAMAATCKEEDPNAPLPCGQCGPCGRISRRSSGDFHALAVPEGKTKIPIAAVRAMLDELALAPVESKVRSFVIEGVGDLMEESQNALLKALEEPPETALLLLIAERTCEVLPTILSRCRIVRLGELTEEEVARVLRDKQADQLEFRAAWSAGSPGQALSDEALGAAEACQVLLGELVSEVAYRDPLASVETLGEFVQPGKGEARLQRSRVTRVARLLQRSLRDALVVREGEGQPGIRLSGASSEVLASLAGLPRGRIEAALDVLNRVDQELDRNPNVKLLTDGLVLELGSALAPPRIPSRR